MTHRPHSEIETHTLIDQLLQDQRDLSAVERFARWHDAQEDFVSPAVRLLVPLTVPKPGEQYAFEVDLDRCSGCKSCVTACHSLNGLDEDETWRSVGILHGRGRNSFQQTVTTACHHCVDPACLHGCPVLAYDKHPVTGIVRHLDDQCIGCQYCVFMCPYEVPKYSARRGIVRKCDMCHQRLAHGEAPACAQACPSEAIRITIVDQQIVQNQFRSLAVPTQVNAGASSEDPVPRNRVNPFLPASPDPGITLPTTRYISAKPLPADLIAGNANETKFQHSHLPLVWMLVLTQLGVGGFALLPFTPHATQLSVAAWALLGTFLGLAGSILHLGRPAKAWRVFLGLRRSWLSREIVVFGGFAVLAAASTLLLNFEGARFPVKRVIWFTAAMGLLAVLCSAMVYHATRRECWQGERSLGRFFGTTFILGSALVWCVSETSGSGVRVAAVLLVLATLAKLSLELAALRRCPDDADSGDDLPADPRTRSAFLLRFRMGRTVRMRLAFAWLGGVILPLLTLMLTPAPRVLVLSGLTLCILGEGLERMLFFRATVLPTMPGGVAT